MQSGSCRTASSLSAVDIPWLPKNLPDSEIQSAALTDADAQLAIARWYDFRDWAALAEYVEAVTAEGSPVFLFESAVEAVIAGDSAALESLLHEHPDLVRARSTRVTHFDPPRHRRRFCITSARMASRVTGRRPAEHRCDCEHPARGRAEVDAVAYLYGGECTTMSMVVSSCHPARPECRSRWWRSCSTAARRSTGPAPASGDRR